LAESAKLEIDLNEFHRRGLHRVFFCEADRWRGGLMSELSRIDERLSQVVELLRGLVSEVRDIRRGSEEERHDKRNRCSNPNAGLPGDKTVPPPGVVVNGGLDRHPGAGGN
jgi:hypothetical protein